MSCEKWQEWIQRNLDGDLSPAEGERLNHHLSTCPVCAQMARDLEEVSRLLSGLPRPEPPVSLVDRILDEAGPPPAEPRVNTPRSRRKWLSRAIPAGVVAAAVILAVIGLSTGGKSRPDPEVFETKALVKESEIPPKSSEENKSGVDSFVSGEEEWSPGGEYQATISENHVTVRDQKGKVVYRSPPLKREEVGLEWEQADTLIIRFPESGKSKRVHLPSLNEDRPGSQKGGAHHGSQVDQGD